MFGSCYSVAPVLHCVNSKHLTSKNSKTEEFQQNCMLKIFLKIVIYDLRFLT